MHREKCFNDTPARSDPKRLKYDKKEEIGQKLQFMLKSYFQQGPTKI